MGLTQKEIAMADSNSNSSNTGIIAALVIFLVVAAGAVGLFAYRGQIFGGEETKKVEINVTVPEPAK